MKKSHNIHVECFVRECELSPLIEKNMCTLFEIAHIKRDWVFYFLYSSHSLKGLYYHAKNNSKQCEPQEPKSVSKYYETTLIQCKNPTLNIFFLCGKWTLSHCNLLAESYFNVVSLLYSGIQCFINRLCNW